ncbi:MAG: NAD-dependent epimerase/dehydratase family protein [Candidatus Paceibacterota bacterium]
MAKSLITGGAGFIGSHLVDLLLEKGDEVVIIDNLSTGNKVNLNPQSKFYEMDIQDPDLEKVFKKEKPDFVFHLAAQIDVRKSVENPIEDAKINLLGSVNVIENAVKYNTQKFIFASTGGAIYGESEVLPTPENYYEKPLSPYGVHKLAVEKSLFFYNKTQDLDYTVLRMSNVYGPRQNSSGEAGVLAIFIKKLIQQEQPIINGDGGQTRDYVFVKDVARAFISAKNKTESDKFNISTGVEISVNDIFDKVVSSLGINTPKVYQDARKGEQKRSCLNSDKAIAELKWSPEYDIDRGIEETVEWFRKNQS